MKTKNIFLVGGSGNIGKLLLQNLSNNKIFLLDKNKPKDFNFKNYIFIKCDLLRCKYIKNIPKIIDVVIFLAGRTGGPNSCKIENLKEYIDINCETLLNFLEVSKKVKIKKIIYTSTEHVYGDSAKKTWDTLMIEPYPKNYYGLSKLLSEKILYSFYKKNITNIDILRIPRVISYKFKNPILSMIKYAFEKKKITINNNIAKFNFLHFDDLMSAITACLTKKNTKFRILNIFNNSKPVSLINIAQIIKEKLRDGLKIIILNNRCKLEHNPVNLFVSNKFSKKILKWKPNFSNKKIINRLIKEYETENYLK
jgi:nucleoside-diphosphate-sugar epimerase